MSASVEESWVVVDKTSGGSLRAKASHESLYLSDNEGTTTTKPRVHIKASTSDKPASDQHAPDTASGGGATLAPELLEWLSNAANESSSALPLSNNRDSSVSGRSYRTNSSSAGSQQRKPRRSSVHATTEVSAGVAAGGSRNSAQSFDGFDQFNEGMFVVKVLEVRQVGATKPMNLQCVAQIGEERFVIPPVTSKPKNYNTWSSKMDDTFVFDVSRQFTFNLGVYGTQPHQPRNRTTAGAISSRVSMVSRRHLGRSTVASDSNPSLMSNSSTRTSAKIKAGFRKIFRNKNGTDTPPMNPVGGAAEAAYMGYAAQAPVPTTVASNRNSIMPACDDPALIVNNDCVQTEETTDEMGRSIEVQKYRASVIDPLGDQCILSMGAGISNSNLQQQGSFPDAIPSHMHHPALARLSTYLPRGRAGTTTSAHEINYNGPRLRAFSNASTISSTPQPLGELYLDFKVDRREKRRATFTLPVVNQDQVAMRGGSHVEMMVVLEYGIIVHETCDERMARMKREQQREEADRQQMAQQMVQQQWVKVDEQDKLPRMRGYLSVFTRSGQFSTWKRYWGVLSSARVLFYESESDEKKGVQPVAKVSLIHLYDSGVPESDLVNIGPTGIELRLSPLAMTDRHRRQSTFPRKSLGATAAANQRRAHAAAAIDSMPVPGMRNMRISNQQQQRDEDYDINRTLTNAPAGLNEPESPGVAAKLPNEEEDATLYKYSDWQCRVYLMLDTLADRDMWLNELVASTVPSAEFARFRERQRKMWKTAEFEHATESLRQSGKQLQVVAAQALSTMSAAHNDNAKKVFTDSVGRRVGPVSLVLAPAAEQDFSGATLTNSATFNYTAAGNNGGSKVSDNKKQQLLDANVCRTVAMAFGKPATFSLSVVPPAGSLMQAAQMPAKKKLRARRRSSSVADLRKSYDTSDTLNGGYSSDDDVRQAAVVASPPALYSRQSKLSKMSRRESADSMMVVEVVGEAMERRAGTVSRRFLFVWNVNVI
ncbi:hypothetical protein GGF37_003460 [Kickxella alabastrina]|nr:hypothetical protein GGF37_003460 [Kickxella alabastrina]